MESEVLRKLQLTQLEILKEVVNICDKHGLCYYLVGGTLLGAVRHGGFIPWDDDLDIAMPRQDYNKFIELCNHGALGEKYYLHHDTTDRNYWNPFAKVRKRNTIFNEVNIQDKETYKGIFIDIFPLDRCKNNSGLMYHLKARIIKSVTAIIIMRIIKSDKMKFYHYLIMFLTMLIPKRLLISIRDGMSSANTDGRYIINYGSNYKYTKQTMPKEIYEPPIKIKFEDEEFCAPHEYILYLERLFGEWQKLPPESERMNHRPVQISFDTKTDNIKQ